MIWYKPMGLKVYHAHFGSRIAFCGRNYRKYTGGNDWDLSYNNQESIPEKYKICSVCIRMVIMRNLAK